MVGHMRAAACTTLLEINACWTRSLTVRMCGQGDTVAGGNMAAHMQELGLSRCNSPADVRRAYKQGAARWHPDKWMHACAADQAVAGERFLRIRLAYEALAQS